MSIKSQWIDRYALRYGAGTALGMMMSVFLFSGEGTGDQASFSVKEDLYWVFHLVVGFLFCYVGSAPVMVFHIGRFCDALYKDIKFCKDQLIVNVVIAGSLLTFLFVFCFFRNFSVSPLFAVGLLVSVGYVCVQVVVVGSMLRNERKLVERWRSLCKLRRESENSEFVESYKTFREHGNAYLTLINEVFLGLVIFSLGRVMGWSFDMASALIVPVWLAPSAYCYFLANKVERDFLCRSSYEKSSSRESK